MLVSQESQANRSVFYMASSYYLPPCNKISTFQIDTFLATVRKASQSIKFFAFIYLPCDQVFRITDLYSLHDIILVIQSLTAISLKKT